MNVARRVRALPRQRIARVRRRPQTDETREVQHQDPREQAPRELFRLKHKDPPSFFARERSLWMDRGSDDRYGDDAEADSGKDLLERSQRRIAFQFSDLIVSDRSRVALLNTCHDEVIGFDGAYVAFEARAVEQFDNDARVAPRAVPN